MKIALSFISKKGFEFLANILETSPSSFEQTVLEASIWPDSVAHTPEYNWSATLHFGVTEDGVCDGYELARDCLGDNCIVTGIAKSIERLTDDSLDIGARKEALSFVMHFIADIHQPMHVGFDKDRGGNTLWVVPPWDFPKDKDGRIIPSPRRNSLHALWDSHILSYMLNLANLSWKGLAARGVTHARRNMKVFPRLRSDKSVLDHFAKIASDSSDLACKVGYFFEDSRITPGSQLPLDYYENAADVVWDQLIKSGIEIARVINTVSSSATSLALLRQ